MKSKLISTMITALFLMFAVLAPPLLSVPSVSASTLKVTLGEWICDVVGVMPSPPFTPPEFTAAGDILLAVGKIQGDISADCYVWSTSLTHFNKPGTILFWHQDFLWVFDKDGTVWVTGSYDGILLGMPRIAPNTYPMTWEGRITGASPDNTNWIGCKICAGKGFSIWWPDPLPEGLSPPWGVWDIVSIYGYTEGTMSISASFFSDSFASSTVAHSGTNIASM